MARAARRRAERTLATITGTRPPRPQGALPIAVAFGTTATQRLSGAQKWKKGCVVERNPLIYLAPRPGLEPGTCGLTVRILLHLWALIEIDADPLLTCFSIAYRIFDRSPHGIGIDPHGSLALTQCLHGTRKDLRICHRT